MTRSSWSVADSPRHDGARWDARTLGYQPALDGLRGVAVLLVLLFHGGFAVFSGGYVGVSVFFTLSGYLITALLLEERSRSGRIGIGRFYARRAKRLLPASLLCLIGIAVLARIGTIEATTSLRRHLLALPAAGEELDLDRQRPQLHRAARRGPGPAVAAGALLVVGHRGAVLRRLAPGRGRADEVAATARRRPFDPRTRRRRRDRRADHRRALGRRRGLLVVADALRRDPHRRRPGGGLRLRATAIDRASGGCSCRRWQ